MGWTVIVIPEGRKQEEEEVEVEDGCIPGGLVWFEVPVLSKVQTSTC